MISLEKTIDSPFFYIYLLYMRSIYWKPVFRDTVRKSQGNNTEPHPELVLDNFCDITGIFTCRCLNTVAHTANKHLIYLRRQCIIEY